MGRRRSIGSFAGGLASGFAGGMKLAAQYKAMMAQRKVDEAAAAKAKSFEADNQDGLKAKDSLSGTTDAPLQKAVESVPAMQSAEVIPVADAPTIESSPLDPLGQSESSAYADEWNQPPAMDAPAVIPPDSPPTPAMEFPTTPSLGS